MSTAHLNRIAYASATQAELSRGELDTMLSAWRRLNARRGITGFLLHDRGSIFQVLEGFPEIVSELYDHIASDARHHQVVKLVDEPRSHRSFGDWSMGLARATAHDLGAVATLRVLAAPTFRYCDGDATMAAALIQTFAGNPWRRMIT
ncbi:MAG: BLUF domain-containing protein [Kofleriaceae bacterium]